MWQVLLKTQMEVSVAFPDFLLCLLPTQARNISDLYTYVLIAVYLTLFMAPTHRDPKAPERKKEIQAK